MASILNKVRTKIIAKMKELWEDDKTGKMARVLWYLSEEVKAYEDISGNEPPVLSILESLIDEESAFEQYLKRIVEDTERAEKDVQFRERMNAMHDAMQRALKNPPDEIGSENDTVVALLKSPAESLFAAFTLGLSVLPGENLKAVTAFVANSGALTKQSALLGVSSALVAVTKKTSSVVVVALAAVELGYEAVKNILRWWKGEISGRRAAMSIIDSAVSIAAGVVGGLGGAAVLGAVGSLAGPIGTIAGAMVGGTVSGTVSANLTSKLVGSLTSEIFDLPKDEALERAYAYFGLRKSATVGEINAAYRRQCLEHHPDKGGDLLKFAEVQTNMTLIKASRGDL